jgi:regulator of replication initiation timing
MEDKMDEIFGWFAHIETRLSYLEHEFEKLDTLLYQDVPQETSDGDDYPYHDDYGTKQATELAEDEAIAQEGFMQAYRNGHVNREEVYAQATLKALVDYAVNIEQLSAELDAVRAQLGAAVNENARLTATNVGLQARIDTLGQMHSPDVITPPSNGEAMENEGGPASE